MSRKERRDVLKGLKRHKGRDGEIKGNVTTKERNTCLQIQFTLITSSGLFFKHGGGAGDGNKEMTWGQETGMKR